MEDDELGPWDPLPLPLPAVAEMMASYPRRWWISGGHALELALGRSWRTHEDTDVSVLRQHAPLLLDAMAGWEIHIVARGTLRRWQGGPLEAEASEDNLWCRRHPAGPWEFDVTVSHGDDDAWAYRRDPKDHLDVEVVIPELAPETAATLRSRLPAGRPCQALLRR